MTPAEKKIIDLSAKIIAMQDKDDAFQAAASELRTCLHEYLENTRERVVELAFIVKNESESKAAD